MSSFIILYCRYLFSLFPICAIRNFFYHFWWFNHLGLSDQCLISEFESFVLLTFSYIFFGYSITLDTCDLDLLGQFIIIKYLCAILALRLSQLSSSIVEPKPR